MEPLLGGSYKHNYSRWEWFSVGNRFLSKANLEPKLVMQVLCI